jgi:hypothetical protein
MENREKFAELWKDAKHYTREEWVKLNTHIEYEGAKKFLNFCRDTLKPYYTENSLDTDIINSYMSYYEKDFEDWFSLSREEYRKHWNNYYDIYTK